MPLILPIQNVVIVENERLDSELLIFFLEKHHPDMRVMGVFDDIEAAWLAIKDGLNGEMVDGVFLDLRMTTGCSRADGFDLTSRFKKIHPKPWVVVVSAFPEHAKDALNDYDVKYFIGKPFGADELERALDKIRSLIKKQTYDNDKEKDNRTDRQPLEPDNQEPKLPYLKTDIVNNTITNQELDQELKIYYLDHKVYSKDGDCIEIIGNDRCIKLSDIVYIQINGDGGRNNTLDFYLINNETILNVLKRSNNQPDILKNWKEQNLPLIHQINEQTLVNFRFVLVMDKIEVEHKKKPEMIDQYIIIFKDDVFVTESLTVDPKYRKNTKQIIDDMEKNYKNFI